jgi:hypothetical protein
MKPKTIELAYKLNAETYANRTVILTSSKSVTIDAYIPLKKLIRKYSDAFCVMYENKEADLCTRMFNLK